MQEMKINENTKGVLLLAKHSSPCKEDWIILVESTKPTWESGIFCYNIYRYASYCLTFDDSEVGFIGKNPEPWGDTRGYRFYKPTKQQRDKIKAFIFKHHYKFDKQNNKIIGGD